MPALYREAPSWCRKVLEKFGFTPYGQPEFRVVWGPSRRRMFGGYWDDNGKHEYRLVHKYGLDPKWILERWRPAYIYGSPEIWFSQTLTPDGFYACGPFPAHGEFECAVKFSTEKGIAGYVPLEPGLVQLTAQAVWAGRINSYSDIRRMHTEEELRKEREQDANFDAMWTEAQTTRPGLTVGYGGYVDKQKEVDDYARRIERAQAYISAQKFKPGFRQQ